MSQFKVCIKAATEIDLWLEADSAEHAIELVKKNDPADWRRVRSAVDFATGSIRVQTESIEVLLCEEDD